MANAIQVASLYGVLSLRDEMTPGLRSAEQRTRGFGSTLQSVGGQMQSFGGAMTAITAPIGIGLGIATNQSRQFSRTMSNVNAILGISGDEAASLRQTLLSYGGSTVAGPQAVAEAYYDIVSGVSDASTHMAILDAATRTSEAGQADLSATTSALISVMNSYKFAAEDASFVSDVLTRTVGVGVGSMDEFGSAMGRVSGLAAQFNVGFDELGGSMAYLTAQGYSASQAGTLVENMITTLLNPTEDLRDAIHALGYDSGQALLEAEGLAGSYRLLSEQNDGLAGLVTNTTALQGAVALTNDGFTDFLGNFTSGIDGATEAARGIQNETATWELFNSKMQELSITVGDRLAPVLVDLLDNKIIPLVDQVIGWIEKNPELTQTILMIAGGLVVLGPLVLGVGGFLSAMGTIIGVVTGAMSLLTTIGLGPLGVALAAGGLLVLAYQNNWLGLKDFIDNTVRPAIDKLIEDIQTLAGILQDPFGETTAQELNAVAGLAQWTGMGGVLGVATSQLNSQDSGGMGSAGQAAMIGTGAQPELFVPSSSGQFIPNIDRVIERGLAMGAAGNEGGGGESLNIYGNITIVANDVDDFRRQLRGEKRRRGV